MALYESKIKSLPRLGKGKVRDIYAVGDDKMLIVTSDRLSAFDVVLPDVHSLARSHVERVRLEVDSASSAAFAIEEVAAYDPVRQIRVARWRVRQCRPHPVRAIAKTSGYETSARQRMKDSQQTRLGYARDNMHFVQRGVRLHMQCLQNQKASFQPLDHRRIGHRVIPGIPHTGT